MTTTIVDPLHERQRNHLAWILKIYSNPRYVFSQLSDTPRWLPAISLIILTTLISVIANDYVGIPGPTTARMMTSESLVFQGAYRVIGTLIGWVVFADLIYLIVVILGGRTKIQTTFAMTAWALTPFALRNIVRVVAVLASGTGIVAPGISGFAPTGDGIAALLMTHLFTHIDIYGLWVIVLLFIGLPTIVPTLPKLRSRLLVGGITLFMWGILGLIGFAFTL